MTEKLLTGTLSLNTNKTKQKPINILTYLPTYILTYIPTYQYIHNFIRIVPIVPHPTFSGSHWSAFRSDPFRYPLKSVPVNFGTARGPFRYFRRSVSVRSGPFRSVLVRFGKSWHRNRLSHLKPSELCERGNFWRSMLILCCLRLFLDRSKLFIYFFFSK